MEDDELDDVADIGHLVGAVRHAGRWRYFAAGIAQWILDYTRFTPDLRADERVRDGLLRVDQEDAGRFCAALGRWELTMAELCSRIETEGPFEWRLEIALDFDNRTYVNGFTEAPLPESVPSGWSA